MAKDEPRQLEPNYIDEFAYSMAPAFDAESRGTMRELISAMADGHRASIRSRMRKAARVEASRCE